MARSVYIAIMVAARNDTGLRLTPAEAFELSIDAAISGAAASDVEKAGLDALVEKKGWTRAVLRASQPEGEKNG